MTPTVLTADDNMAKTTVVDPAKNFIVLLSFFLGLVCCFWFSLQDQKKMWMEDGENRCGRRK
jgi:hypothetical protein